MDRSHRLPVVGLYAAVVVTIVVAFTAALFTAFYQTDEARDRILERNAVVDRLASLTDDLNLVEAYTSRYLAGGEEDNRASAEASHRRLLANLDALAPLLADRSQALVELRRLTGERLTYLDESRARFAPGTPAALARIDSPTSRPLRERSLALVRQVNAAEKELIERLRADFLAAARTVALLNLIAVLLLAGGGILIVALFVRYHAARAQAETLGKEELTRLRLLADAIPGVVSYVDRDLRYRFVNRFHADIFRTSPNDAVGKSVASVVGPEPFAQLEPYFRRALAGEHVAFEREFHHPVVGTRIMRALMAPSRDSNGNVDGVISVSLDVTHDRQLQEQADMARDAAQRANEAKSRFLAIASHDLRQPLHALTLFMSGLRARVTGDEAREILTSMETAVRSMQEMFRGLLDISKIDAGILVPAARDVDVGDLLRRLAGEFRPIAAERGLRLRVVPGSARVTTDPVLLESVLRNFLSNAVKFTRRGRILLGTRRRRDRLRIEVYDTGPGIPTDLQERAFEEFARLPSAAGTEGVGLGLAIARRLADLIGARIDLRSQVGRGSRFALELPCLERPAPTPAITTEGHALVGRRLLIVDDNPLVLAAVTRGLTDLGATVAAASTVDAALAQARAAAPDAAIIDFNLGDSVSGLDLADTLSRLAAAPIPALLVTGSTDPATLSALARSGRQWLTKPVEMHDLCDALSRLLRKAVRPASAG